MTDQNDLPNVSMANTKKELLDAYDAAKKRFRNMSKDLLDAEKARQQMEKKMAAATADEQAAQDPVKRLHDLRGAISRELNDLAERFESEIETYRKVQSAIEAKQSELDTLYSVEAAASDLAALIDAQREKRDLFEEEMASQKQSFEQEMQEVKANWQREKADHERQIKERAEELETQRKREKETYEYTYAREKEQRQNELNDELLAIEKEITAQKLDFQNKTEQRTSELDRREAALGERETQMSDLQNEVETFPQRKAAAVDSAVKEATDRLTQKFESEKALMEARHEGEKNVLLGKIEALEKIAASQESQIADLSRKSEQAYEKVQDIANRAVTASRRETYPFPTSQPTVKVSDENKS